MSDKYELYHNTLPHDIERFSTAICSAWNQADPMHRENVGHEFFRERRALIEQNWFSFVKYQEADLLPKEWDKSRRNIVFFISSEDEFASIDRVWDNRIYRTQVEAIETIADTYRDRHDFCFYVRTHPNLAGVDNSQTRALKALSRENVVMIAADSPISSYALLDTCEKVVVFGSTVGVEATYSGKPAILCSSSYYDSLDVAYRPTNHAEVVELINAWLPPRPTTGALQYGYYVRSYGQHFKYFEPSGLFSGKFKGIEINPPRSVRLAMRGLAKLRSIAAKARFGYRLQSPQSRQ
jgi:hypothetical protein